MTKPISILLLEDSDLDAGLIRAQIEKSGINTTVERVVRRSDFEGALRSSHYDVILSDYSLPDFDGVSALTFARQHSQETLFIFVSGALGEEIAIEAMQRGATDYVVKQRLKRLVPVLRRAAEDISLRAQKKESEHALQASELRFRELADAIPQMVCATDVKGHLLYANRRAQFSSPSLVLSSDKGGENACHPEDRDRVTQKWRQCLETGDSVTMEFRLRSPDNGSYRWHLGQISPLHDEFNQVEGWIVTAVDVEEQRRREQALEQNHKELLLARETLEEKVRERTNAYSKLSARLLNVQDEERRKFARELHDGFGQSMAALKMNVDRIHHQDRTLSPEKRQAILAQSCTLLEECVAQIRTISYLLHPPLLDEAGFAQAAMWYARGFEERTGIKVLLDLPANLQRLPSGVELVLFRVLQASLSNVHRHSQAKQVEIVLNLSHKFVNLRIWDDGVGIPHHKLASFRRGSFDLGVGLAGMRERVRDLGGAFDLANDTGTTIKVTIPLPSPAGSMPLQPSQYEQRPSS